MLYMVEVQASMERGNEIDSKDGPGPVFAYIVERFKPQAIYGTPTRRQIFMVVELADETIWVILDMPDGDAMTKFALTIGSRGNAHTTTVRAYPQEEISQIVSSLP